MAFNKTGSNNYVGSIEAFKYRIPNIQRASLYDVTIPNFKYGTQNGSESYVLKFSIKTASFPQASVGDITVNYMGRTVHFYGDRDTGGDWSTTVILDGAWAVYDALYAWNQAMNGANRIVSEHMNSHNNFKVDAYVTAYTTNGEISRRAILHGLFPKTVGEVSLGWDNTSAIDLSVTWTYDYWTVDKDTSSEYEAGHKSNKEANNTWYNLNYLEGSALWASGATAGGTLSGLENNQ